MTRRSITLTSLAIITAICAYGCVRATIVDDLTPLERSIPYTLGELLHLGATHGVLLPTPTGVDGAWSSSPYAPLSLRPLLGAACDKSECEKNVSAQCKAAGFDKCQKGTVKTDTLVNGTKLCSCTCDPNCTYNCPFSFISCK